MHTPQRCEIIEADPNYTGVLYVRVPGIYPKGKDLPQRMSRLIRPAALALDDAMVEIERAGGHLYFSDMFRSAQDQTRAHNDYKSGRKSAYSPPAGGSMHEAARAIDIDVGDTGIGLAKVKYILKQHGWIGIADRGSECWHHDYRGQDGQAAYDVGGSGMSRYRAMARYCIAKIDNKVSDERLADHVDKIKLIQGALNKVFPGLLEVDGISGDKTRSTVINFQTMKGLEPDGIVGPLTRKALELATAGS